MVFMSKKLKKFECPDSTCKWKTNIKYKDIKEKETVSCSSCGKLLSSDKLIGVLENYIGIKVIKAL